MNREKREGGPAEIAAGELQSYIEKVVRHMQEQLQHQGYGLAQLTLEIHFKDKALATSDDEDAEASRWAAVVRKVAKAVQMPNAHLIDPYGSGDGATVSFEVVPLTDDMQTTDVYKIGLDGKPTGHFQNAAFTTKSAEFDISGLVAFKVPKKV